MVAWGGGGDGMVAWRGGGIRATCWPGEEEVALGQHGGLRWTLSWPR